MGQCGRRWPSRRLRVRLRPLAYYSFNAGDLRDDSGHGQAGLADGLVELVTSNDACLPFVADLETGKLSEWSDAVPC